MSVRLSRIACGQCIWMVALVLLCVGCVNRHVSRTESGHYVDGNAFAQITPGKTSAGWVKSILGDPSETKKTDAGTEIWKWSYQETKSVDGELLVFKDHSVTTNHRQAMVEIRDGMVINKWFDDRDLKNQENFN